MWPTNSPNLPFKRKLYPSLFSPKHRCKTSWWIFCRCFHFPPFLDLRTCCRQYLLTSRQWGSLAETRVHREGKGSGRFWKSQYLNTLWMHNISAKRIAFQKLLSHNIINAFYITRHKLQYHLSCYTVDWCRYTIISHLWCRPLSAIYIQCNWYYFALCYFHRSRSISCTIFLELQSIWTTSTLVSNKFVWGKSCLTCWTLKVHCHISLHNYWRFHWLATFLSIHVLMLLRVTLVFLVKYYLTEKPRSLQSCG